MIDGNEKQTLTRFHLAVRKIYLRRVNERGRFGEAARRGFSWEYLQLSEGLQGAAVARDPLCSAQDLAATARPSHTRENEDYNL